MPKQQKPDVGEALPEVSSELPTCFIIMPISDSDKYPAGHFGRVYEYIIKPACDLAGFRPIRADDVKVTNYIALDIVKQIIESDMAICDLSNQNPNVLYEVGIRQAFNLPVTFIKDIITKRIFDIQGFRDVAYDESLRIDTVNKSISELAEVITNTYADKDTVNSLVTLLGIEPAAVKKTPISLDTELILNSIKTLGNRIANVEKKTSFSEVLDHTTPYETFRNIHYPENVRSVKEYRLLKDEEVVSLKQGDKIYSKKFGEGIVEENISTSPSVLVSFKNFGSKKLVKGVFNFYAGTD